MQKNFDLSTGSLSEEFRWDLVLVGAEWVHEGCALTENLNSMFSPWESGLESHVFLHRVFLMINVFSATFRKELSNFSTRVSNEPFQYAGGIRGGR